MDTNDVPSLNTGITATARHLSTSQSLLEDEARAWTDGVLEDLKRQRDTLVSVREMFDRRDRLARNNIPQLEKRIENSERKLQELRARPAGAAKPGEIEKVEDSIFKVRQPTIEVFVASPGANASHCAGQRINCATACAGRVHQGVHPR